MGLCTYLQCRFASEWHPDPARPMLHMQRFNGVGAAPGKEYTEEIVEFSHMAPHKLAPCTGAGVSTAFHIMESMMVAASDNFAQVGSAIRKCAHARSNEQNASQLSPPVPLAGQPAHQRLLDAWRHVSGPQSAVSIGQLLDQRVCKPQNCVS